MIGQKAFAHHAGLAPAKHLPRTTLVTYAAPAKSLRYDRTVRQHTTAGQNRDSPLRVDVGRSMIREYDKPTVPARFGARSKIERRLAAVFPARSIFEKSAQSVHARCGSLDAATAAAT